MSRESETVEILRFARSDGAVRAKAFVEIINSLDCANAHIEFRYDRLGWVGRLKDSITGEGARRQQQIDTNLVNGFKNLWHVAQDLQLNQTRLAQVAATLAKDIGVLQENVAFVGEKVLQLNDELSRFRDDMAKQMERLESRIDRLSAIQNARLQLDAVAGRLKLGAYANFSLPGQLCLAVANLYYGPFYDALKKYPDCRSEFMEIAEGILGGLLGQMISSDPGSLRSWNAWQQQKPQYLEEAILEYLVGPDNMILRPITAKILCPQLEKGSRIPKFISSASLASRVLDEIFEEGDARL